MANNKAFDTRTIDGRAAIDRAVLKALAPKRGRSRSQVGELAGVSDMAAVSASLKRHVAAGSARYEGELGQRRYFRVVARKAPKVAA